MAGGTKVEDDSDHHHQPSPTHPFPTPSESHHHHHHHHPKTNKSKSHDRDRDPPASASAKRRCVSTACIACRRRKSKVRVLSSAMLRYGTRIRADQRFQRTSVMGIHQAVLPVPPFTEPNASMIPTRTIVARASTKKILTTLRRVIPPYKPSSRLSSTIPRTRYPIWSNR